MCLKHYWSQEIAELPRPIQHSGESLEIKHFILTQCLVFSESEKRVTDKKPTGTVSPPTGSPTPELRPHQCNTTQWPDTWVWTLPCSVEPSGTIFRASLGFGTHLQEGLHSRCGGYESFRALALATLLDPRFKNVGFGNPAKAQENEKQITLECASLMRSNTATPEPQSTSGPSSSSSTTTSTTETQDSLWELFDSRIHETQAIHSATADATVEVKKYLKDAFLPRAHDPLSYWKERAVIFPHLYVLAKKYLCMPATSVPCERIFSKAGEIISKKRSRLSPSTAEQLIYLNKNL
ncbi:zinc finger BED domain-containing protein 4-like [Carassius gibelio]|uniref:zinc finger BED domain-containing protein 4-like n=1 Tax=Carassius gibelio TaxID=101364 RepID=UPI0022791D4C|nr:zinc finger BED domain-containing protein 4-like [Carassius gibelio]